LVGADDKKEKLNPEVYHRRSMRLKDYDYSQPGAYFFTLVTQGRENISGRIDSEQMVFD
jgi:putative transposase